MNPRNLSSIGEQAFEKGRQVLAGVKDLPTNIVKSTKLYSVELRFFICKMEDYLASLS